MPTYLSHIPVRAPIFPFTLAKSLYTPQKFFLARYSRSSEESLYTYTRRNYTINQTIDYVVDAECMTKIYYHVLYIFTNCIWNPGTLESLYASTEQRKWLKFLDGWQAC